MSHNFGDDDTFFSCIIYRACVLDTKPSNWRQFASVGLLFRECEMFLFSPGQTQKNSSDWQKCGRCSSSSKYNRNQIGIFGPNNASLCATQRQIKVRGADEMHRRKFFFFLSLPLKISNPKRRAKMQKRCC